MTPKEKANELWTTYRFALSIKNAPLGEQKDLIAKQCALIAIEEIYNLRMTHGQYLDYDVDKINYYSYWEDVKQEIQKL